MLRGNYICRNIRKKTFLSRVRRQGTLKRKHTGIHIIETYLSLSVNNPTVQKELTSKLKQIRI